MPYTCSDIINALSESNDILTDDQVRLRIKLRTFMDITWQLSNLSTCGRKACGAIITSRDLASILAIGYNGQPSGVPHSRCDVQNKTNCGCTHAEANALIKLQPDLSANGGGRNLFMFITRAPCRPCASLIVNNRKIDWVFYSCDSCKGQKGLALLDECKIYTYKMKGWDNGWKPQI